MKGWGNGSRGGVGRIADEGGRDLILVDTVLQSYVQ